MRDDTDNTQLVRNTGGQLVCKWKDRSIFFMEILEMTQIHWKSAFENMTFEQINEWVQMYQDRLVGSAIFTRSNSWGSKLVQWGEKHLFAQTKEKSSFIPSHTGSIIYYHNDVYIFDMKPPRASVQPLAEYLYSTDEDYVLVLRDFPIDTRMFSLNCEFHIGEVYPYLSALRSVFTKRESKYRKHCSEFHCRELQKQGVLKCVNPEITPDELFHILTER